MNLKTLMALVSMVALAGCGNEATAGEPKPTCASGPGASEIAQPLALGMNPEVKRVKVSSDWKKHWRDGNAELGGYSIKTSRYGQLRKGQVVLVYVAEPMDTTTWIKDDGQGKKDSVVDAFKLNHTLNFSTGIYPYSVMTSVFTPVDGQGRERFAPAKISFSSQEWCGHVYHHIHPKGDRFHSQIHSYFGREGDAGETVKTAPGTLYEDALWIQLRELDGPFNGGKDWSGKLVPALWERRKSHRSLRPVPATINRQAASLDGEAVTRFVVKYESFTRTFELERAYPHRILRWTTSAGEEAKLLKTTRLPYWKLHDLGDEKYLEKLGL